MTPHKTKSIFKALFLLTFLLHGTCVFAEDNSSTPVRELSEEEELEKDFKSEEAYIDQFEGVRSKHYVRRAILSHVISTTSRIAFDRFYVNHLMGFNAVYQRITFAKYTTGVQGLSVGYVTQAGHGLEAGMEVSSLNNIFAGYRFFYRPEKFSLWPFAGLGAGYEIGAIKFAEGPPEAINYNGAKYFGFTTLGVLVPLVDVALKAEFRFNFYGKDRLCLTQGIGAILFF